MSADLRLMPPVTHEPDEQARFKCRHCGDLVTSASMAAHMTLIHRMRQWTVNASVGGR